MANICKTKTLIIRLYNKRFCERVYWRISLLKNMETYKSFSATVFMFLMFFVVFIVFYGVKKIDLAQRHVAHVCQRRKFAYLENIKLVEMTTAEILSKNSPVIRFQKAPIYQDVKFLNGGCKPKLHREIQFRLTVWLMHFAAQHNITWFLTYGTLIGGMRHKDMVPWDNDSDMGVLAQDADLLRKLQTPRNLVDMSKINLVCRPGDFCPYNGDRMSCTGEHVTRMMDSCSFCSPICRLVTHGGHLDLWIYGLEVDTRTNHDNKLKVFDEGMSEYRTTKRYYDLDMIFPLQPCGFMALTVLCPHKSEDYLTEVYGDWSSPYKCVNKTWMKTLLLNKKNSL